MLGYQRNYPARSLRGLRRISVATPLCLAAILSLSYLVVYTRAPFALALIIPFLVFIFILLALGTLEAAFGVRIVPILEHRTILRIDPLQGKKPHVSAPGPYEASPLAGAFLMTRTLGKAIARNYRLLVEAARERGIPTLEEFGQADVYDRDIPYYDPSRPVEPLRRLAEVLRTSPPAGLWRPDETVDEIEKVLAILEEASRNGRKVCFAIL